ncbi:MAG: hypothetical protein ACI4MI_03440 [Christensenellales bacterium]
MIITFCGHADYLPGLNDKIKMIELINEISKGETVEFYLGGYGGFDRFAMKCAKIYQETNQEAKLILVVPYIYKSHTYYRNKGYYDATIYPEIENVPLKWAIVKRNQWMVDRADVVIAYVEHSLGGAYKTYSYAIKKRKLIYNFCLYR